MSSPLSLDDRKALLEHARKQKALVYELTEHGFRVQFAPDAYAQEPTQPAHTPADESPFGHFRPEE